MVAINKQKLRGELNKSIVSSWIQEPKYNMTFGQKVFEIGLKYTPVEAYQMADITPDDVATCVELPSMIDGIRCVYRFEGIIKALPSSADRWDPVIGGVSIGGLDVTAGTIGGIVFDTNTGQPYILTNYHVATASMNPSKGEPIVQPGVIDGGKYPADLVGYLERWGELSTIVPNNIDAALILPVREFLLDIFLWAMVQSKPHKNVQLDDSVYKYGRTTGYLAGNVSAINTTVNVSGFSPGEFIQFEDVHYVTPSIAAGGDSGSRVFLLSDDSPVGLVFAGSSFGTYIIPASTISSELNVSWHGTVLSKSVISIQGIDKNIITDDDGKARLQLKPGTYNYVISAEGHIAKAGTLTIDKDKKVAFGMSIL